MAGIINHNIIYTTSLFSSVFFFLLFTTKVIGLLSYICSEDDNLALGDPIWSQLYQNNTTLSPGLLGSWISNLRDANL